MAILPSPQLPLWHSLDAAQVLQALGTAPGGLSETEAARRLAAHGPPAPSSGLPSAPIWLIYFTCYPQLRSS
ncbi:MAG: cation-transporting P-type ATPase [Candidatus Competibacter denitrificans]